MPLRLASPSRAFLIASLGLAAASAPGAAGATTVNCNIPQPCALYSNANNYGVQGISAKTSGVVGTTTWNATSAANATSALKGNDASTNNNPYNSGFYGFSAYGYGGKGKTYHGTGIYGTATQGTGVLGDTTSPKTLGRRSGVVGTDLATDSGTNDGVFGSVTNGGYGVEGQSGDNALGGVSGIATTGVGVEGVSSTSYGVVGKSDSGLGVTGSSTSGVGVLGQSADSFGVEGTAYASTGGYFSSSSGNGLQAASTTGNAIYASTSNASNNNAVGAYVTNPNGNATDINGSYIALLGRSDAFPLTLTNTAGANLFYVDGSGNVFSHGSYGTFAVTRTGQTALAYAPRSTTPSVEDVGSAQLVDGVATVRLDPAFAASIDVASPYHVFLTPGGDTRGLYIASKTPTAFVVRETQGGRGRLAFDYRVIASATGHTRERMTFVAPATSGTPHAPIVKPRVAPAIALPPPHRARPAGLGAPSHPR